MIPDLSNGAKIQYYLLTYLLTVEQINGRDIGVSAYNDDATCGKN